MKFKKEIFMEIISYNYLYYRNYFSALTKDSADENLI